MFGLSAWINGDTGSSSGFMPESIPTGSCGSRQGPTRLLGRSCRSSSGARAPPAPVPRPALLGPVSQRRPGTGTARVPGSAGCRRGLAGGRERGEKGSTGPLRPRRLSPPGAAPLLPGRRPPLFRGSGSGPGAVPAPRLPPSLSPGLWLLPTRRVVLSSRLGPARGARRPGWEADTAHDPPRAASRAPGAHLGLRPLPAAALPGQTRPPSARSSFHAACALPLQGPAPSRTRPPRSRSAAPRPPSPPPPLPDVRLPRNAAAPSASHLRAGPGRARRPARRSPRSPGRLLLGLRNLLPRSRPGRGAFPAGSLPRPGPGRPRRCWHSGSAGPDHSPRHRRPCSSPVPNRQLPGGGGQSRAAGTGDTSSHDGPGFPATAGKGLRSPRLVTSLLGGPLERSVGTHLRVLSGRRNPVSVVVRREHAVHFPPRHLLPLFLFC